MKFVIQPEPHPARESAISANGVPQLRAMNGSPMYLPGRASGIYAIKNLATGLIYIGCSKNLLGRWRGHRSDLSLGKHGNMKLQNAWNKYGESAFVFMVVELCPDDQLLKREQHFIDLLNVVDGGYNIARQAGRERLGVPHTEASIQKMRESHQGKVISTEHRAKLALAFKGRQFTDEWREKIKAAKRGVPNNLSAEGRAKIAASKRGKPLSAETRAKISAAGRGRVVSEETRARQRSASAIREAAKRMGRAA